jgi:Zn-dependent M28 family amino/carboxypeptidase
MRVGSARVLRYLSMLLLCVGAGLLVPAGAGAVSEAGCAHRVNSTPGKLVPCIRTADLWAHMQNFQAIADANPGADGHPSRNSGEPGYKASADYVANLMRAAGYNVSIQTYTFPYFSFVGTPSFSEVSPTAHNYALVDEWNPGRANGTANAAVQPAGGIVIPPTPTPSSASGCDPSDFSSFVAGRIALIQRGSCTFSTKIANAQAAGASGVIIFNEGNPGRTDVFNGSLSSIPTIPVAFTSFDTGVHFLNEYNAAVQNHTALPVVSLVVRSIQDPNRPDYNVIAESKGGNPNSVLVVDAHLDAIYGAGMLDNASGSATILDVAQMMRKVNPLHKLRFIWFGGEELGLLGSQFYVNNLSPTELGHIAYDLDADVTATPNYVVGILDPAGPDLFGRTASTTPCSAPSPSTPCFPDKIYGPSQISRDQSIQYFNSIGLNHELFSPVGTDAFSFNVAGVPASGLLTGQDCCKSQEEVNLFGGETGNFEGNLGTTDGGCVDNPFRWCDNLSNNDPNVLTFMSKAFANTTVRMAFNRDIGGVNARMALRAKARARRAFARQRRSLARYNALYSSRGRLFPTR